MYSLVLMAATAAGPDAPAADEAVRPVAVGAPVVAVGGGCCGGTVAASCYGSCFGSCYGGRVGIFHRHKHSCHGCNGGSCSGWSCFGSCWGSCYGSYSMGCWGSCYGSYSYGCAGSCYGSYSYHYGCYGSAPAIPPAVVIPQETPAPAPGTNPLPKGAEPAPKGEKSGANIRFQLPANATLFVDGQRTAGEGAERAFFTPPLQAGQRYFYDVRAELVVNGETVREERRVVVTAGSDLVETFPRLTAAAANSANVAGR